MKNSSSLYDVFHSEKSSYTQSEIYRVIFFSYGEASGKISDN